MPKSRRRLRQVGIDKRIGAVIRSHRQQAKMTMRHISNRSGISFPTYQRYETGATTIPIPELLAVSSIIGAKPADILNEAISYDESGAMPSSEHIRLIKRIEKMPKHIVLKLEGLMDLIHKN